MTNKKSKNPSKNKSNHPKIKLLAIASYQDKRPGSFLVIKIKDIDNNTKNLLMPRTGALNLGFIKRFLITHQFECLTDENEWEKIKRELNRKVAKRAVIVTTPGYVEHGYLLANNVCIGSDNEVGPFCDPENKLLMPIVDEQGTLKEWQDNVAGYALYSSRLMLSLCTAFSAYLLRWSGIYSGGFHIFGESSTGKSTCLYVAVSIQGPRENMRSWSTTEAALELLAAGHNDTLLPIDEIKDLDENPAKASRKASKIIYKIASEQGKSRSTEYQTANQQSALKWRVCLLSTGELSLTEHAADGGAKRMLGEEVRVVDVPADAGHILGILESLPDDVSTPDKLIKTLDINTRSYYGTAQRQFLEKFTKDLKENKKLVKQQIRKSIDFFLNKYNIDRNIGYQVRLAERFALTYVAGIFAMNYGVLPFSKKDILVGISNCYQDAATSRPLPMEDRVDEAKKKLERVLRNSTKFLDIRLKEHGYTCEELKLAWGYKVVMKGRQVRVLTSATLKKLIKDEGVRKRVLDAYKHEGRLLCDSDGKKTRPVISYIRGCRLPRGYCFLGKPSNR